MFCTFAPYHRSVISHASDAVCILLQALREEFQYNPKITREQFFSTGFAEQCILLAYDILVLAQAKHKELHRASTPSCHLASSARRHRHEGRGQRAAHGPGVNISAESFYSLPKGADDACNRDSVTEAMPATDHIHPSSLPWSPKNSKQTHNRVYFAQPLPDDGAATWGSSQEVADELSDIETFYAEDMGDMDDPRGQDVPETQWRTAPLQATAHRAISSASSAGQKAPLVAGLSTSTQEVLLFFQFGRPGVHICGAIR